MMLLGQLHVAWLALFLCELLIVLVSALWLFRASEKRLEVPVLLVACALPVLYLSATSSGLLPEHFVRFVRPWGVPFATLCSAFVLLRCALANVAESRFRRLLRDVLSTALALVLGLSVAGLEIGRPLDRLAVLVAVDRSRSIELVPNAARRLTQELQVAELSMQKNDRLGVLAFGASAVVESPLRTRNQEPTPQVGSVGREATDVEQAIWRALTELPADARGKIVILSDGVATRGNTSRALAAALAAAVPIDVVALEQRPMANVRLVSLSAPTSVSEGETFNLRAVVESTHAAKLEVRVLENGQLIRRGEVSVSPGQDVLDLQHQATGTGLLRQEVQLHAITPGVDELADDNRRATFIRVRGPASALVLAEDPSNALALASALESAEIRVTSANMYGIPVNMSELARYDLLALCDIPARLFSPSQLDVIEAYVKHLGGGLLLMGSDQTLGPGGYGRTPIENASPVSFDLKQDRRRGSLAEVIIIDYSGSMAMTVGGRTKLQLANEAAIRSAELLSETDHVGVMHVDTEVRWTHTLDPLQDRESLERKVRGVGPGGGGIYVDISLREAYQALTAVRTNLKHVLLFADGSDAEQMDQAHELARRALRGGITTSVVALGKGMDVPELERLSQVGSGRFYLIEDASRLPTVFAQETILAARNAIHEVDFVPEPRTTGGLLKGIDFDGAPPLHGYVITLPKARAQIALEGPDKDPILASWSYGLGKSAAFTSDLAPRWGKHWVPWPGAAQLFAQLGRSLARVHEETGVRLRAEIAGGQLSISADVLDDQGTLDSYRQLATHVTGPDGFLATLPLVVQGPGRYGATLALERPGAYMVSAVELSSGKLVASAGVELHSADELRPTGTDRAALERIARETGGQFRDTLAGIFNERLGRRFAYQDVTSALLWTAGILLVLMVAARRLSLPDALVAWIDAQLQRWRPALAVGSTSGKSTVLSRLLSAKQRQKAATPARTLATPVTPNAAATGPQTASVAALSRGQKQPLPPHAQSELKPTALRENALTKNALSEQTPSPASPAPQSAPRKLSAAEILLAKRRSRR